MIDFGSYFTGGGVFEALMKVNHVFGVECDPSNLKQSMRIADAYEENLGGLMVRKPVQEVDPAELPAVDWFHASPVCKNASNGNPKGEENNIDTITAQATADYITHHKPRIVTIENVWGYRKFDSWKLIKRALEGNGYYLTVQHVNMASYGVPQARKRLICVALRGGPKPTLPPPTHAKKQIKTWGGNLNQWVGWYEAIEDLIPVLPESQFAPWQLELIPDHMPGFFVVSGSPHNHGQTLTVRHAENPIFVLTAQSGTRQQIRASAGRVVKMTPRALARFQTLPDWYRLPDKDSDAVTLIGNGVPSLFGQKLAEHLEKYL